MSTFAAYRRRMLDHDPDVGRHFPIASIVDDGVIVTRLAQGVEMPFERFVNSWIIRPDAGSQPADRERYCVDFDPGAGKFAHHGTAYADTTATNETLEVLFHEPDLFDRAIQHALRASRFWDTSTFAARSDGRYNLGELAWLATAFGANPINLRIGWSGSPVLSRNRYMDKWYGYQTVTAGALAPDDWTLTGELEALYSRSTTTRRGPFSLSVSGDDEATLTQTIGLLETGITGDSLRSQTVTAVLVGRTSTASSLLVQIGDGTQTLSSDFHTASGNFEEVSQELTIAAAATTLILTGRVAQSDTAEIDECYVMLGSLDDTVRRDQYRTVWWDDCRIFEHAGTLQVAGRASRSGQLVVQSERPYAEFTASRVATGTADADENDAPLDLIAYRALAFLWEPLDATKHLRFKRMADNLQSAHMVVPADARTALDAMVAAAGPRFGYVTGRIR